MHWGSSIFGCSPCFTHFYFFLHNFPPHFHHIYSFSRLIDMVIHFQGACYRTSYFPPHLGPLSPWISVLAIGCFTPAPMACNLLPRWLGPVKTGSSTWNTTGYQDGWRVVNRRCKMESISFVTPSSDSPPDCPPSPLPNIQSSSPRKALGPSPLPQEPGRSPSRSPEV